MGFTLSRRAKGAALATSACLVTACSALVDLNGLAGEADGGVRADASVDAAPGADGGVAVDGGGMIEKDAGALDAAATDANVIRFCPTQDAYFCDDFDNGALGTIWDGLTLDKNLPLRLDDAAVTSPPNSLFMSIPKLGSMTSSYLSKSVPSAARVSVAFDWRMDASHPNGETDVLHMAPALPTGFSSLDIYFGYQSGTTQLEVDWTDTVSDGGNYHGTNSNALGSIKTGAFQHFVVTVDLGTRVVAVTNGALPLTSLPLPSTPSLPGTLAWVVDMGGEYVSNADETEVSRLDNIVINAQ